LRELKRINVNIQPKDYEVFKEESNLDFSTWVRDMLAKYAKRVKDRQRREYLREEAELTGGC